tara:strand:- start:2489 stop:3472 length:984 start_codon:yes stop_codon:yes gene_type:complete
MRIAITGEKGFIAKNLVKQIENYNYTFVSLDKSKYSKDYIRTKEGEVCVYRNSIEEWSQLLSDLDLDVIVHNAAVVGTDVVALNPESAIGTNVLGTHVLTEAANNTNTTIVYIGTTVIYDTYQYQESDILEDSKILPRTNYAIQKYAGEMTVKNNAKSWLVVRPLFAYGGEGDMNSLISKSLFCLKNKINSLDMFLNPEKIKDYMHVEDFCSSIMDLIKNNILNDDFNITAENPHNTLEIVKLIEEVTGLDLESIIQWHPQTDYLGNHRLSNKKFIDTLGFSRTRDLKEGIRQSWKSIKDSSSNYNPLRHLNQAKDQNIDLKQFFPK